MSADSASDPKPIGHRKAVNAGVVFPRGRMAPLFTKDSFSMDSWMNLISGMGVPGHDRKLATTFAPEARLRYQDLTDIYRSDGLGRIILHRIVGDMTRAWWTVEGDTDKKIEGYLKKIHAKQEIKKAIMWGELYGGSLAIMVLDDGGKFDQPVNLARLKGVLQLLVFDRYRITINPADLYLDPSNDSYGHPQVYRITPIFGEPFFVHESRCLRFEGDPVPDVTRFQNQGWADSIFQSCWDRLRATGETYNNIEHIISEFVLGTLTIHNLMNLLAEGKEKEVQAYLTQVDQGKHVINSVLLDENQKYERISSQVSGLKDLVDLILESLAAQKGLPMCLLFGRSQGGLSDDEAAQVRFWYDRVSVFQEEKMLDQMERLVNYVNISMGKPVEENSPIKFNPLWQPTQKDIVDMRNKQALTDQIYLESGVIADAQGTIGQSRFGSQAYSFETTLSENESDPKFKTAAEEQAEADHANALALAAAKGGAVPNKNTPAGKPVKTTKEKVNADSSDGLDVSNTGLKTLVDLKLPQFYNGFINLSNNELTTLAGLPRIVNGAVIVNKNPIEDLLGAPEKTEDFHCCSCAEMTSLTGGPKECTDFHCHNSGITNFIGCPKVKKDLHAYMCKVSSMQGLPDEIPGDLLLNGNQLTTLDYLPKKVGRNLDLSGNPVQFKEADVRARCQVGGELKL
jgi:hypothetical protein